MTTPALGPGKLANTQWKIPVEKKPKECDWGPEKKLYVIREGPKTTRAKGGREWTKPRGVELSRVKIPTWKPQVGNHNQGDRGSFGRFRRGEGEGWVVGPGLRVLRKKIKVTPRGNWEWGGVEHQFSGGGVQVW